MAEAGVERGAGEGQPQSEVAQIELAEISAFVPYLRRMVKVLVEDDAGDTENENYLPALDDCLKMPATIECLRKFIADQQTQVLLVERIRLKDNEDSSQMSDHETDNATNVVYQISLDVHFTNPRTVGIVLIKSGPVIEAEKPFNKQARILSLSDGSPYETLHSYISSAVSPYFKSYIKESGRAESYRDGDKVAPSVEKKLMELEMGLLHLQQNIEIPEVTLVIHPTVQAVVKKATEKNVHPSINDFGELAEDSTFLNQLQNGVNRWIREIQKVTKLDRDPTSGTALQEITFWLNLERALIKLQAKRESPEVTLTLNVLKHGKRFHATVSFDTDTGLKQAIDMVNDYNLLMKDFPINDLLSASELDRIRMAVTAIFNHLRKIRNTYYPVQRCLHLLETISKDLQLQMLKVLSVRRLMHINFEEFDKIMNQAFEIFSCWDDEYDKLQLLLRDLLKKKRDEQFKIVLRLSPIHKRLQTRLEQMRRFRRQHEQLRTVIVRVLRPVVLQTTQQDELVSPDIENPPILDTADAKAIEDVDIAYEHVKDIDCLDLSKEGTEAWESALKRYEERIDRVEARITTRLRDQLESAKNANEMFRIFSRFNALFVRPHIRGAIREYQTQLIQRVKEDIETLHEKFKVQYVQSKASTMSHVHDLPPVSGSVVWARQIDRQLSRYLRRVEDVLGKGWENHIEGQKLKADGDSFRLKLNPQSIFDDWVARVQARNIGVSGRIFCIDSVRGSDGKPTLRLRVNFPLEIMALSKEVRNFKHMGFRVPLAIVNKAHQANELYPFAISLIESVHIYESMNARILGRKCIELLIAGTKKEIQQLIMEGTNLVWESYKLDSYVKRFSELVTHYEEKVEELLNMEEQINVQLTLLDTCQYAAPVFQQILATIQKTVDNLSLHLFSNLIIWVEQLDEQIEKKLAYRLQEGAKAWTAVLQGKPKEEIFDSTENLPEKMKFSLGGDPKLQELVHEIRLTQQVMYLSPSVEEARQNLLQQLFAWEAIICTQNRISSTRYQVGAERSNTITNYRNVLGILPEGQKCLDKAYSCADELIGEVKTYVDDWLRYQALWDLQPETLFERLDNNLSKWMTTLQEIKKTRSTFDTAETRKQFGPITIDYARVQSKVSLKYDSWHKDVLKKFGSLLGTEMQQLYSAVSKSRSDLEQQSVDAGSTSEAVGFITYVQSLKRKTAEWEPQVDLFKEGQKILERQRFQFPSAWLYSDNLDGEWSAFCDILSRKDSAIQTQVTSLQNKIRKEDEVVKSRITDLLSEWDRQKPNQGGQKPDVALGALSIYEHKLMRLKEDVDNIIKAKEALELPEAVHVSPLHERLCASIEELNDLKNVWNSMKPLHQAIDEIREKPWVSVQPKKLRQSIDALLNQMRELPSDYRNYESYDYVKTLLQGYAKMNILIIELKSETLKERHWKQLMKQLKVNWVLSDLTLGQVWDADLQKHEAAIKDTILVAQGEMALEVFLKQLREYWQNFELDLINYQSKTKLIRGWDDLFNKLKEHINGISAMKLSPYYKEFEEDAAVWEERLNRITSLFDVWIDVQRRWVYLEGIFSGSADIKTLLPVETSKFKSISSEFLGLMKKVSAAPRVMEIINIQGIQRLLERLADLLAKIQKALGEYLERERSSFPRFYFVGDEDLLEIIGNSKNIPRLQKHFKKMFAGVSLILLNEDNTVIHGVASREGEEVKLMTPIQIKDHPRVNEWLSMVEKEVRSTLAFMLIESVKDAQKLRTSMNNDSFITWLDKYPAQIIVISAQILWSEEVDGILGNSGDLSETLENVESMLSILADSVLHEQPPIRRRKIEHLITEYVHKRDVSRLLIARNVTSNRSFLWLQQMRLYLDPNVEDPLKKLCICMANARFSYGFEYLGVQDKLVQTPLTDRCYLTMTQALDARLGGSPFGPAGTGKTESVKALGNQLGRFVLVFNCDENFDFQAMGRIFVGLCQVGAWGCFDEFNRLEERMLSAVSQQIQAIQETLRSSTAKDHATVELIGRELKVHPDMAIFITMNPGYAGRSNLPDNLKQLFRSLAMTQPDRQLIAEVMLFSQGFRTAEKLASKIVPFFKLCSEQLSNQTHYDFGLRALKYVLVSAGNVKRDRIQHIKEENAKQGVVVEESSIAENLPEQEILIQSVCETMAPKLVAEDIPLLFSLLSDVFPGVPYGKAHMEKLRAEMQKVCAEWFLCYAEEAGDVGYSWTEKVIQLYQITQLNHGLMMVGTSGTGKSMAWRVLLAALERVDGIEGVAHVIDPKAISKDSLYGTLDPNTREWTDGLFTSILRKIIDNVRGEIGKRQWIIFDGDVDPEWVENLNSVLDDNKLLTLPNGERLALPPNVRIMFEVQDLKFATLATVSRCGMIWFSEDVVTAEMCLENYCQRLRNGILDDTKVTGFQRRNAASAALQQGMGGAPEQGAKDESVSPNSKLLNNVVQILLPHFAADGLVQRCLEYAQNNLDHVMEFTVSRAMTSFFSMLNHYVRQIESHQQHNDFEIQFDQLDRYISKAMVICIIWSFSGDGKVKNRQDLCNFIRSMTTMSLPQQENVPITDFEVSINGEWEPWQNKVPQIEVEIHKVAAPDVVVPTIDTVLHENLLYTWLAEHKPLVLCGPPGSGKTMTLFSSLRSLPDLEVVGLNFSSATTPELLLKTFDHYCEYKRTPNGLVLCPLQLSKWIVLFCDEINLPDLDKYGTQRVISFLRQLVEHGGFYRTSDHAWVTTERIQFVGACNPPTDPGRKPLSARFLRHVPVIYVDYPGELSLKQIYGTFNRAMLRIIPSLRSYAEPLTSAMVEFYLMSQENFTQEQQPHYVYSPRELTRWVRGICEAIRPLETLNVEGLVRLWAHEALRLFQDRLVTYEERKWTDEHIDCTAAKHFPNIDTVAALQRPIMYSCWLSKIYVPVEREQLRDYVKARLRMFYEEELDVQLVAFDEVLDHVLRIDRIFRQPQGHLLLIGVSGSGRTTLSRFVAWINGLSVFQVKVHSKYTAADFDEDLRNVLRRVGCKGEKICFIMDESNVMDSSFLERINTLLANGEVPGLFEGDEHTTLMTQIKEASQKEGLMLDSAEELYRWFTQQIMRNLHVVFTMNPTTEGLKDRAATSPALFNRCVLNWFGDWSKNALFQVGQELTRNLDIDRSSYSPPDIFPYACDLVSRPPSCRDAVVNAFVYVHDTLHQAVARLVKRGGKTIAITPRHFLDFISHHVTLYHEKRAELEEQQLHLNVGLNKIKETEIQVKELQKSLSLKSTELEAKNAAANAKLKQMLSDQQEAEKKKQVSEEIQAQLNKQLAEIAEKKRSVEQELAEVEPAVIDAQNAVKSIKKQHLVEIRSMGNPPSPVKLALESICLLLGESSTDWKAIRGVIVKDDFISRIINLDADSVGNETRQKMKSRYFENPEYNYEKVNRASQACGPMVKWALAQINFSDMLHKVEPYRNELKKLERAASENKKKCDEVNEVISQLEKSIASYKEEYAVLISQAQAIKSDLATVQAKVDRSIQLLHDLQGERQRWEQSSDTFRSQVETIVGDVLLSAAFVTYAGYFDQQMRQTLFFNWSHHLEQSNVQFRMDISRVEYLSNPDERLRWQKNCLPADDLCTENAIMLKRFNRFPLIIDPSGQAVEFLMNELKEKKITKTSFLDDAFRKSLESALRFGNPLLVQDVESYDPILNPILNREVKRTGGRVLITLGDQDIDLSPTFQIYLSTRDPTVEFSSDVCSRVTFVNFTVTLSSLQSQCLNYALKSERPDIDSKRSDLMKLQGEFALRLRHLEKSLLQALNDSKGRILDDDHVITTLETLKHEAAEVNRKVQETETIIAEVEKTSQQYTPFANYCASVYFALEQLNQIHFLYQYSLQFFLEIFGAVLNNNPHLSNVTDYAQRLSIITDDMFQIAYDRVARGLLHEDRLTFAILLCRIYLKGIKDERSYDDEFNQLLVFCKSVGSEAQVEAIQPIANLSKEQMENLTRLSALPAFANFQSLIGDSEKFVKWLTSRDPERNVPVLWDEKQPLSKIAKAMYAFLVIHALRPDRLLAAGHLFVKAVLGENFMSETEKVFDFGKIVESEVSSHTPVLLCSTPGYDASGRVSDLAVELSKGITPIAIGSAEGFTHAENAINSASKSGRWVLLKNVHLAPQWLVQLEKKLHSLNPHPNFRLFLTMEIHPKLPVNLLRAGRIIVYEPPPGIKANLLRTFSTVSAQKMSKIPAERARLYFLLAWLHAIVQERLIYAPIGWSKRYEFSEADLRVAFDTFDTWIEVAALGRSNLPSDKVPWEALQVLLSQCIYGGRIDNDFDQKLLECFIKKLFVTDSFNLDFALTGTVDDCGTKITMPEGVRREQVIEWVESLQLLQSPSWLGLPNNAENVLLTTRGQTMIRKLLKMSDQDEELAYNPKATELTSADRPQWMSQVKDMAIGWLKLFPEKLPVFKRSTENIKDPLYRFFERELNLASRFLTELRHDLDDLMLICKGQKKQTNHHRMLFSHLNKGLVPENWRVYSVPAGTTVSLWIHDFAERVKQFEAVYKSFVADQSRALKKFHVWLGGLFTPEAYITATRQYVTQANAWSLEELILEVQVAEDFKELKMDECSFGVTGLKIMGATCSVGTKLVISEEIWSQLKAVQLRWIHVPGREVVKPDTVSLPVYLHSNRHCLLFTLNFNVDSAVSLSTFYERGVAIICNTTLE